MVGAFFVGGARWRGSETENSQFGVIFGPLNYILYKPPEAKMVRSTVLVLPTSRARDHLSQIITHVQDPRNRCLLTRHGKQVAAIVSLDMLARIDRQLMHEGVYDGTWKPGNFTTAADGHLMDDQEAAEFVQQKQVDRLGERRILARAGLDPVPGGEILAEVAEVKVPVEEVPEEVVVKRRWWWLFWRRRL